LYWLGKPEYLEKTTDLTQVTDKTLLHNINESYKYISITHASWFLIFYRIWSQLRSVVFLVALVSLASRL
jgi:hypothetical protein